MLTHQSSGVHRLSGRPLTLSLDQVGKEDLALAVVRQRDFDLILNPEVVLAVANEKDAPTWLKRQGVGVVPGFGLGKEG